jgi:Ion channel
VVSFADAYWFAYISTTTVGLGDYILAPQVIQRQDLVTWPVLFLVGFVFFAAFIGKFSDLVRAPFQHHATSLADRLRHRGMVYGESFDNEAWA